LSNRECLNARRWRRHEEILIDGFYALRDGNVVFLQTGIRVPISKTFYPKLLDFWEKSKDKKYVYEF
jgi:hypothetical protein